MQGGDQKLIPVVEVSMWIDDKSSWQGPELQFEGHGSNRLGTPRGVSDARRSRVLTSLPRAENLSPQNNAIRREGH